MKKLIRNIIIVLILLGVAIFILKVAPDYKNNDITDKTNFIINNSNVTNSLKHDLYIKDGIIYVSRQDILNFFDNTIYLDEKYNTIITTSETKVASLKINENVMMVNGSTVNILGSAIEMNDTIYLPMSEMQEVYNIELTYLKEQDIVLIDSLNRRLEKADCSKDLNVKSKNKTLCRNVDKVEKGEKVILISTNNGWAKIRTSRGKIGYVKEEYLANNFVVRENIVKEETQTVSLVWDYYSKSASAPNRNGTTIPGINVVSPAFFELEELGKGEIIDKVGNSGKEYIKWAHSNNYKVWAMFQNESMIKTTSEILNDYELREKTISDIVDLAVKYNLDGINLDFEYMYEADKNLFSRFVIELYPRLKECGKILSVDVTAPDGSPNWSGCFDRHVISKNSDYIIFMAYDQHGQASTEAGTVAGYDWIETNLKKLVGTQEEVDSKKLILAIPFYTRVWTQRDGEKLTSSVASMKSIDKVISTTFAGESKVWDDNVKQYYIEKNSTGKKMWIEDIESIRAKLSLIDKYELGGAAFWDKGREDEGVWNIVDEMLFNE